MLKWNFTVLLNVKKAITTRWVPAGNLDLEPELFGCLAFFNLGSVFLIGIHVWQHTCMPVVPIQGNTPLTIVQQTTYYHSTYC